VNEGRGPEVAVNETGGNPETVAVIVLAPATGPSVQLPTVATPFASVVVDAPVSDPPPPVIANVTATAATAAPALEVTFTLGRSATGCPTLPACDVAEFAATAAGVTVGAVVVTVNVTGVKPATVAVIVFTPAAGPSVQLPTVATPLLLVVVDPPESEPPPTVTENVTGTDASGLPAAAVTLTLGRIAACCPATPDCVVVEVASTAAGIVVFGVGCGVVESEPPHDSVAMSSTSAETLYGCIVEDSATLWPFREA
jgi:hypothetical protein